MCSCLVITINAYTGQKYATYKSIVRLTTTQKNICNEMMLSRDRFFFLLRFPTSIAFFNTPLKDHDTLDDIVLYSAVSWLVVTHFQFLFSITVSYTLSYHVRRYRLQNIATYWYNMKWRLWIANCMLTIDERDTQKWHIFFRFLFFSILCAHTSDELHQITTLYETKV